MYPCVVCGLVSVLVVSCSVICCQDGCFVVSQRCIASALRFPQGKDPCGIPQGNGFFFLVGFVNSRKSLTEVFVGWFGRRL